MNTRGATRAVLAVCLMMVALVACKKSAPTNQTSPPGGGLVTTSSPQGGGGTDVAGTWSGTYKPNDGSGTGTFQMVIAVTSTAMTGTISVDNSACFTTGTVNGAISGGQITFGAVKGSTQTIAFTGTVSGDQMSGTYTSGAACGNATGTWNATRQ